MVLLYTLKKLKRKLKMQGLGPFVINELKSSGAVRLETLDGEQMVSFINGSRLRLYNEPLTQEMMDRMNVAKTRHARAALLKKEAQDKANARAKAIRARKHKAHILVVSTTKIDDELPVVKPFQIATKLVTQKIDVGVNALVDSGAYLNILSWNVWEAMGNLELAPSLINFVGFSTNTDCLFGGRYCLRATSRMSLNMFMWLTWMNPKSRFFWDVIGCKPPTVNLTRQNESTRSR